MLKTNPIKKSVPLALAFVALVGCGQKEEAATEAAEEKVEKVAAQQAAPIAEAPVNVVPADVAEEEVSLESTDELISYMVAFQTIAQFREDPILELNDAAVRAGVEDALNSGEMRVSEETINAARGEIQDRAQKYQQSQTAAMTAPGEAFLEENKKREGVVETASGLQYEVMSKGDSDKSPTASDNVKVHYHGTLIDGSIFDSSVNRGEPISFSLGGVIPGWTEGLQLMSVGDKFKFFVPQDLAYGLGGRPGIPGGSVLIFEVELLGINE